MSVGRNEPCPCGSGRKYKRCCLRRERLNGPIGLDTPYRPNPRLLRAARSEPTWETDIVSPPWIFEEEPDARPGLLGVMAGPWTVHFDLLRRPSGEPEEMAAVLLGALETAAERVGGWPEEVIVRHPGVALHMEPALRKHEAWLTVDPYLPELDDLVVGLFTEMAGGDEDLPDRFVFHRPETWAAWGLPGPRLLDLLEAAADLHRAVPWRVLLHTEGIEAVLPDGGSWHLFVSGSMGEPRGVVFYADRDDFYLEASATSPREAAEWMSDRSYAVFFHRGADLPHPMRREFASRGWPAAGPDGYPRLLAVNTPAGGISGDDARDLAAALRSLAALVRAHGEEILDDHWRGWRDPGTGVELALMEPDPFDDELDDILREDATDEDWWEDDLGDDWWEDDFGDDWWEDDPDEDWWADHPDGDPVIPPLLAAVLDESGRAELRELLRRDPPPSPHEVNAVLGEISTRHNRAPQPALGGLSPEGVQRLLDADWSDPRGPVVLDRGLPLEALSGARTFRNARAFLEALIRNGGTRATAARNLNRAFVREMMKSLEWPGSWIDQWHRADLEGRRTVVNEGDLPHLHTLRLLLDAAGLVELRKGRWTATKRGESLLSDERAGELYAHLFETYFQTLDLASLDRGEEDGSFQRGVAFSLHRLRDVGDEWRSRRELADALLLPFVRRSIPVWRDYDPAPSVVEIRLLDPLEGFALLEREGRPGPHPPILRYRYRKTPLYDRFLAFEDEEDRE